MCVCCFFLGNIGAILTCWLRGGGVFCAGAGQQISFVMLFVGAVCGWLGGAARVFQVLPAHNFLPLFISPPGDHHHHHHHHHQHHQHHHHHDCHLHHNYHHHQQLNCFHHSHHHHRRCYTVVSFVLFCISPQKEVNPAGEDIWVRHQGL